MAEIVKGTTPTIQYTFSRINPANLTAAYLTIREGDTVTLEKDITTASIGENDISWTLTQAETLAFEAKEIRVMLNWLLQDGTRGTSKKSKILIQENDKEEVI